MFILTFLVNEKKCIMMMLTIYKTNTRYSLMNIKKGLVHKSGLWEQQLKCEGFAHLDNCWQCKFFCMRLVRRLSSQLLSFIFIILIYFCRPTTHTQVNGIEVDFGLHTYRTIRKENLSLVYLKRRLMHAWFLPSETQERLERMMFLPGMIFITKLAYTAAQKSKILHLKVF